MITIDDFARLDICTAKVISAENHPNADKLLIIKADIGNGEIRQLVAGIRKSYGPEQLVGKNIIMLTNLKPVVLRGIESNGMLLAASNGNDIVLLQPDKDVPSGCKIS